MDRGRMPLLRVNWGADGSRQDDVPTGVESAMVWQSISVFGARIVIAA
jgi:hypothetical protein